VAEEKAKVGKMKVEEKAKAEKVCILKRAIYQQKQEHIWACVYGPGCINMPYMCHIYIWGRIYKIRM
jgi:hypothetical protein